MQSGPIDIQTSFWGGIEWSQDKNASRKGIIYMRLKYVMKYVFYKIFYFEDATPNQDLSQKKMFTYSDPVPCRKSGLWW